MLKLSKLTDYATVIMTYLAQSPDEVFAARDIATNTRIALPTVSKILKQLGRAGLLLSERGVQGGYSLADEPQKMTLKQVIHAMERGIAVTECSGHHSRCELEPYCAIRGNWQLISLAINSALESVTLAELARPMHQVKFNVRGRIPIAVTQKAAGENNV